MRAATPLELMTRARKLTCRYRLESATDGVGACRIGDSDLAARMLRTGYVKRSASYRWHCRHGNSQRRC